MKPDKASPESCKVCRSSAELALFLFKIYFRGSVCHLCINCLLKNHHGMFCPICFDVYKETPPPPHLHLMCLKCPSIAHRSCVVDGSNSDAPISAFRCPSCADPKFSYFKFDPNYFSINKAKNAHGIGDSASVSAQNAYRERDYVSGSSVDREPAKVLDAAARIAASSMRKALSVAMIDSERRMEEATLAKKKVKEALNHIASLLLKEKDAKEAKNADGEGEPVSIPAQNADDEENYVSVPAQKAHGEGDSVSRFCMALGSAAAVNDAKQRMEESALASKKAQEALDYVASLLSKEKDAEEDYT